ncbi:MAG: FtsX-like permease family protein [Bacteroidales bacterium]|jgi:putative ABC transport system permease protein|nr:FtsX-like permease family protein [Bacteroidales bacterium]
MIIQISWKNVWRNKARSLVIMSAITIGLFGGIFSYAVMLGGTMQRLDSAIKNETANLQLHNPAYLLEDDIKNSIENPQEYIQFIEQLPEVQGISDRLKSTAMISTAYGSSGVILNGVYPEKEIKTTRLFESITDGEYLLENDQIPIVIGDKLAKKLNADVGDKLILSAPSIDGEVAYGAYILKGIYDTQNDMFDGMQAFIKKGDLAELVGIEENTTSEIAISLFDTELSDEFTAKLSDKFLSKIENKSIVIRTWKEIDPLIGMMVDNMSYFGWLFVVIILIALIFGIINTMLMVVLERVREIGMLMAIGMNKIRVFAMIMWETVFLSITGGIIGMLFSLGFITYFKTYGMDFSMIAEGMNSLGFSSVIYPEAPLSFYFEVSIMIVITAILASIYPALKALKLHPAEAVRE